MSLTIKDLNDHAVALQRQIDEAKKALDATWTLIRQMQALEKQQVSTTNGVSELAGMSIKDATRELLKNWTGKRFRTDEIVRELESSGVRGSSRSKEILVRDVLAKMMEEGQIERKNISSTGVKKFIYFWKEGASSLWTASS